MNPTVIGDLALFGVAIFGWTLWIFERKARLRSRK